MDSYFEESSASSMLGPSTSTRVPGLFEVHISPTVPLTVAGIFTYLGCYTNDVAPFCNDFQENEANMSVEWCYTYCHRQNFKGFSLEGGTSCKLHLPHTDEISTRHAARPIISTNRVFPGSCGNLTNVLWDQGRSYPGRCNVTCPKNATEYCGGFAGVDVYYSSGWIKNFSTCTSLVEGTGISSVEIATSVVWPTFTSTPAEPASSRVSTMGTFRTSDRSSLSPPATSISNTITSSLAATTTGSSSLEISSLLVGANVKSFTATGWSSQSLSTISTVSPYTVNSCWSGDSLVNGALPGLEIVLEDRIWTLADCSSFCQTPTLYKYFGLKDGGETCELETTLHPVRVPSKLLSADKGLNSLRHLRSPNFTKFSTRV